mmetsp:Transcript_41196/g.94757  ORF Transcript_41196/g.94757 Transcript_41196/m.94757 type:complete len:263 (-) Transcript_41196:966-1754(-)
MAVVTPTAGFRKTFFTAVTAGLPSPWPAFALANRGRASTGLVVVAGWARSTAFDFGIVIRLGRLATADGFEVEEEEPPPASLLPASIRPLLWLGAATCCRQGAEGEVGVCAIACAVAEGPPSQPLKRRCNGGCSAFGGICEAALDATRCGPIIDRATWGADACGGGAMSGGVPMAPKRCKGGRIGGAPLLFTAIVVPGAGLAGRGGAGLLGRRSLLPGLGATLPSLPLCDLGLTLSVGAGCAVELAEELPKAAFKAAERPAC